MKIKAAIAHYIYNDSRWKRRSSLVESILSRRNHTFSTSRCTYTQRRGRGRGSTEKPGEKLSLSGDRLITENRGSFLSNPPPFYWYLRPFLSSLLLVPLLPSSLDIHEDRNTKKNWPRRGTFALNPFRSPRCPSARTHGGHNERVII